MNYVGVRHDLRIKHKELGFYSIAPQAHLKGVSHPSLVVKAEIPNRHKTKFIDTAIFLHDNFYDYSKVDYKKKNVPVIIIHPVYGEFEATPEEHLAGKGHPKEEKERKSAKAQNKAVRRKGLAKSGAASGVSGLNGFVRKARERYGDLYDYSKAVYQGATVKLTVIHPEFGEFRVTPREHLRGTGHPKARESIESKSLMTLEEFIVRASEIHGNIFDYSKVVWNGFYDKRKIIISHPDLGDYEVLPTKHLLGQVHPKMKRLNFMQFLQEGERIYGNLYDYSSVRFSNPHSEIVVRHPVLGEFITTPVEHIWYRKGHPACRAA